MEINTRLDKRTDRVYLEMKADLIASKLLVCPICKRKFIEEYIKKAQKGEVNESDIKDIINNIH